MPFSGEKHSKMIFIGVKSKESSGGVFRQKSLNVFAFGEIINAFRQKSLNVFCFWRDNDYRN